MGIQFSFIIPFRNRPLETLDRCIQSIASQTYRNFELILLDYGSDSDLSTQVKEYTANFSFIKYIYSESRGWYWSRGEAINQAIPYCNAEQLVFVDVDLIFSKNFLEIMADYFKKNEQAFFVYKCYYLPEDFKDFDTLDATYQVFKKTLRKSSENSFGLMALSKNIVLRIGGYHSFLRVWGFDGEIAQRLKKNNVPLIVIDDPCMYVFHQWHPRRVIPKGWLVSGKKLSAQKSNYPQKIKELISIEKRPALSKAEKKDFEHTTFVPIEYPKEEAWNIFLSSFQRLASGEFLCIRQDFAPARITAKSRLGLIIKWVNSLFRKFSVSYRLMDIETSEKEYISIEEIKTFIFYFVLHNEEKISDYYLEVKEETVFFLVGKK